MDPHKRLTEWQRDFPRYAREQLRIVPKSGRSQPFVLNAVQEHFHAQCMAQLRETGRVRQVVPKARQHGLSTLVGGMFFHLCHLSPSGKRAYVLAHTQKTAVELGSMVTTFWESLPSDARVPARKMNDQLKEWANGGRYRVATASTPDDGRGGTVQAYHGSEVAYWDHAQSHISGSYQQLGDEDGTWAVMESTARGPTGFFHGLYREALSESSEWRCSFYPWYANPLYRRAPADGFALETERPTPEVPSEVEYAERFGLDDAQMAWRRAKIRMNATGFENPYEEFMREYPATAEEAFMATGGDSFIDPRAVRRCADSTRWSRAHVARHPLLVGVDPATSHGPDDTVFARRRGPLAYGFEAFPRMTHEEKKGKVRDIILQERPALVCIDASEGGGDALLTDLLADRRCAAKVHGIQFGAKSQYPQRYANKRAEIWDQMRLWIEDELSQIPDSDRLVEELCGPQRRGGRERELRLESKEEMRGRGIASPDMADALACTFEDTALGMGYDDDDLVFEGGGSDRPLESFRRGSTLRA